MAQSNMGERKYLMIKKRVVIRVGHTSKIETKITGSGVGQRHFCQAQAAGVIVQSTIVVQNTWEKNKENQNE